MVFPLLLLWMKQGDRLTAMGRDYSLSIGFVAIAGRTG
jgi:hypothetical protein